jgi:hypothetical protein
VLDHIIRRELGPTLSATRTTADGTHCRPAWLQSIMIVGLSVVSCSMYSISLVSISVVPEVGALIPHEVATYMAGAVEPMTTDVLHWWAKVGRVKFPNLAKLARQYLGCPASSASSERVFSLAGRVFGDHNQNLTPQNLEERMCIKCKRSKLDGIN